MCAFWVGDSDKIYLHGLNNSLLILCAVFSVSRVTRCSTLIATITTEGKSWGSYPSTTFHPTDAISREAASVNIETVSPSLS